MPHLQTPDGPRLPFSGAESLSRHTSYEGASSAQERVGRQCLALLAVYTHGPLTDRDAALLLNVERTTINARRSELTRLGLVQAVDTVIGTKGVRNVRWGLVNR